MSKKLFTLSISKKKEEDEKDIRKTFFGYHFRQINKTFRNEVCTIERTAESKNFFCVTYKLFSIH